MAEETIKFNIQYDIKGIDGTIRSSQRLLYFMNSIRLSITDFQRLLKDPSIENIFWTGIQLSSVWTNLIRLIRQANLAAGGGAAANLLGLGTRGGMGRMGSTAMGFAGGRFAAGQTTLFGGAVGGQSTLWATIVGFAAANPIIVGAAAAAVVVGGAVAYDMWQRQLHKDWQQRQRDVAKHQGLEY